MCPEDHREIGVTVPPAERIILWSLRALVLGHCKKLAVDAVVAARLEWIGVERVAPLFDAFACSLIMGSTRPLDIGCVCHRGTSRDERSLLDALALAQHGRSFESVLMLRSMLAPEFAAEAVRLGCRIGDALSESGVMLALPRLDTTQYAMASHRQGVPVSIH